MHHRPRIVSSAVALLVAFALTTARCGSSVEVAGSHISIREGLWRMEGSIAPSSERTVLLKDLGRSLGGLTGEVFVTFLDLDPAMDLYEQHGDFFRCDSPGAAAGRDVMGLVVLFARWKDAREELGRARQMAEEGLIPVVTLEGSPIVVHDHRWLWMGSEGASDILYYHVDKVKIVGPWDQVASGSLRP